MSQYLFVGERRSPTAVRMGVTWVDGRLAAKPLFEALRLIGVDPLAHTWVNLFPDQDTGPWAWVPRPAVLRTAGRFPGTVVGLGKLVSGALARAGVRHTYLVHPAARGTIRKSERYRAHVRDTLAGSPLR